MLRRKAYIIHAYTTIFYSSLIRLSSSNSSSIGFRTNRNRCNIIAFDWWTNLNPSLIQRSIKALWNFSMIQSCNTAQSSPIAISRIANGPSTFCPWNRALVIRDNTASHSIGSRHISRHFDIFNYAFIQSTYSSKHRRRRVTQARFVERQRNESLIGANDSSHIHNCSHSMRRNS